VTSRARDHELFTIRPSFLGGLAPLDISGLYTWDVQSALVPWRGIALGVALLLVGTVLLPRVTANPAVLFSLWFMLLAIPTGLEVLNRRDVITDVALVRQRGILGRIRHSMALAEIERVEYSFPRWGRYWNVGDVVIHRLEGRTILRGIRNPAAVAQLILDAKARSVGRAGASLGV
jgi:hypothetical protein